MFDILDSNLDFKAPSRTNSMKKINKKDSSPPSHNISTPTPVFKPSLAPQPHPFDSLDINMDMSKSRDVTGKGSQLNINFGGTGRTSMFKNTSIEEDDKMGTFGRTEQTINPSRVGDSFVSMRNMKPPLRARDSSNMNPQANRSEFGGIIIEEDPTIANSSHRYQDSDRNEKFSRRSSIDDRVGDISTTMHRTDLPFDKIGSDFIKEDSKKQDKAKRENKEEAVRVDAGVVAEYEKQIEQLKGTFSRQVKFLEESLEKQVKEGQEQRRKIMGEAERMLEQQRSRMKRVYDEELKRVQEMSEWERKRMEESHQAELECLRRSLEYSKGQPVKSEPSGISNSTAAWGQQQREHALEQQEKSVSLREAELERRIAEFSGQRRRVEDELRQERKRLMNLQTTLKRESMESRRSLAEERQKMAEETGQMEIEVLRRKDQLSLERRELELARDALQREREQVRRAGQEVTLRQRELIDREQGERERAGELELDLMKKIKVVEMRAHELSNCKQAVRQTQQSSSVPKRPFSAGKNAQSAMSLLGRQREMQQEWKTRDNKKLDLGGYVQRVEKIGRVRHHKF